MKIVSILMLACVAALANAGQDKKTTSGCTIRAIGLNEGIYSLQQQNVSQQTGDEFIQISRIYSQDGGGILVVMGIKFKDAAMTAEKISRLSDDELRGSAEKTNTYFEGNTVVFAKIGATGESVICHTLAGWETNNLEAYQALNDVQLILKPKVPEITLNYQLLTARNTAVTVNSW